MPYAVMQKELTPPSVDQLRRAFRSVPGLTAFEEIFAYPTRNAFQEEIPWWLWRLGA